MPTAGLTITARVPNPCVGTGEPLVGALVFLYDHRGIFVAQTITDVNGTYMFSGLPLGRYFVEIQQIDCLTVPPSSSPSFTFLPTLFPTTFPSAFPSSQPSTSTVPSLFPSLTPSLSPTSPTSSPTGSFVRRERVPHPCFTDDRPLIGATVILFDHLRREVARTVTDNFGYYRFAGLPLGRYYTIVDFDYSSCNTSTSSPTKYPSLIPSDQPSTSLTNNPSSNPSLQPSITSLNPSMNPSSRPSISPNSIPSMNPSMNPSANPSSRPSLTTSSLPSQMPSITRITISNRVFNPCVDTEEPLVGVQVLLFNHRGVLVANQPLTFTDVNGYYEFVGLPPGRYFVQVDYPACDRRRLSAITGTTESQATSEQTFLFYKSGLMCNVKPSIEVKDELSFGDVMYFDTLDTCCANMFWYDMDGCIARSSKSVEDSSKKSKVAITRFYPTYVAGKLCHSKTKFDSWEQSYTSLQECCKAHFNWDLTACLTPNIDV
jgi:hypothetical protein